MSVATDRSQGPPPPTSLGPGLLPILAAPRPTARCLTWAGCICPTVAASLSMPRAIEPHNLGGFRPSITVQREHDRFHILATTQGEGRVDLAPFRKRKINK